MSTELQNKIATITQKRSQCDPASEQFKMYSEVLAALEGTSSTGMKVHTDPNDLICESCQ